MWTSQIVVTTQRHPNQGLVGSGPVRLVIPMGRWMRKHQRKKMEKQVTETQTCFDKHFMNEQVKKHFQRWLQVQRKPEPHKPEGGVQVPS